MVQITHRSPPLSSHHYQRDGANEEGWEIRQGEKSNARGGVQACRQRRREGRRIGSKKNAWWIRGMVAGKMELGGRRNCPEGHPLKTAHHLLKARPDCECSDARKERERKKETD